MEDPNERHSLQEGVACLAVFAVLFFFFFLEIVMFAFRYNTRISSPILFVLTLAGQTGNLAVYNMVLVLDVFMMVGLGFLYYGMKFVRRGLEARRQRLPIVDDARKKGGLSTCYHPMGFSANSHLQSMSNPLPKFRWKKLLCLRPSQQQLPERSAYHVTFPHDPDQHLLTSSAN
jgi:hypothetical protein